MKQQEYIGFGKIDKLKEILLKEKVKKVFVVTQKNSFVSTGAKEKVDKIIPNYFRFNDFSPNPKIEDIKKGYSQFVKEDYNLIIAIGGGSAIDAAKAIKMFYFEDTHKNIPIVAIPTTSGTGSEATYFIVYYQDKEKQSAGKKEVTIPEYVILDPDLVLNLPKNIAASTGMDALSQAVESYWSINSTIQSKKYSAEAIKLILNNLEKAINTSEKKYREKMLLASNLSGKAINITKTTACHSIAYPITSFYNVPHGHAVGLTLSSMLLYNSQVSDKDCNDSRKADYVKKTINEIISLMGAKNVIGAKEKIEGIMKNIGLETKLSRLGLSDNDLNIIIKMGFNPKRVNNNPRILTKENLGVILKQLL